jgi:ribosome-binding protein aMBF1 (putative translation factor)
MTEAQRQKPLKHRELSPGLDEFAQALKETNTAKAWITNPALIKAMEKLEKISTPKPVDESGFQEASLDQSFYETSRRMTPDYVKRASKKTSDEVKRWLHLPGHPE